MKVTNITTMLLRPMLTAPVEVGKKYLNASREYVQIERELKSDERQYDLGARFVGTEGDLYTADGKFWPTDSDDTRRFDLALELPDNVVIVTHEDTVIEEPKLGFFSRLAGRVRRNPVKTVAVVGGAGVVAYGAHNYYNYGEVLPGYGVSANDIQEVTDAVASFLNR